MVHFSGLILETITLHSLLKIWPLSSDGDVSVFVCLLFRFWHTSWVSHFNIIRFWAPPQLFSTKLQSEVILQLQSSEVLYLSYLYHGDFFYNILDMTHSAASYPNFVHRQLHHVTSSVSHLSTVTLTVWLLIVNVVWRQLWLFSPCFLFVCFFYLIRFSDLHQISWTTRDLLLCQTWCEPNCR